MKRYDIHIYTAGSRDYARECVQIMDKLVPAGHSIFGGTILSHDGNVVYMADGFSRIMTRDESMSVTAKSLRVLMPRAEVQQLPLFSFIDLMKSGNCLDSG